MPERIQRKRTAGWRMPKGAVYVGRPTKWGNPYRWSDYPASQTDTSIDGERYIVHHSEATRRQWAVTDYRCQYLRSGGSPADGPTAEEIRGELAGKDLVCWCSLAQPCHADILLEVANAELRSEASQ